MNPKPHKRPEETRRRQQHTAEIRAALRALGIQLALLNHHVSARLELDDVDLDCLHLIDSHEFGMTSPLTAVGALLFSCGRLRVPV